MAFNVIQYCHHKAFKFIPLALIKHIVTETHNLETEKRKRFDTNETILSTKKREKKKIKLKLQIYPQQKYKTTKKNIENPEKNTHTHILMRKIASIFKNVRMN